MGQLTANPGELRQAVPAAEGYFIEGNIDSKNKFERMKVALTELGLEEELSVRFASA